MTVALSRCGLWAAIAYLAVFTAPALAQQPSPQSVEAARTLVQILHRKEEIGADLQPFLQKKPAIVSQWIVGSAGAPVKLYLVYPEIQAVVFSHLNELHDKLALLYAKTYDESALTALADFYSSPLGQKFAQIQSEVFAEIPKMLSGGDASQTQLPPARLAAAGKLVAIDVDLPETLPFRDDILRLHITIYAERLSLDELESILALHNSAAGKKFDATRTGRKQQVEAVMADWLMELAKQEPILFEADAGE